MTTKKNRIFVYNSLKRGHYWHNEYLSGEKSEALGSFITTPEFTLYVDALPFMVREDSKTGVKGEVYLIDDDVLKSLDKLESCPIFTKREIIEVMDDNGERVTAWAYVHPNRFKHKAWVHKEFEWV